MPGKKWNQPKGHRTSNKIRVTTYEGFGPKKTIGYMTKKEFREWKKNVDSEGVEYTFENT